MNSTTKVNIQRTVQVVRVSKIYVRKARFPQFPPSKELQELERKEAQIRKIR